MLFFLIFKKIADKNKIIDVGKALINDVITRQIFEMRKFFKRFIKKKCKLPLQN